MATVEYEKAYGPRDLSRIFKRVKSESDIRASFRKRKNPCPCIRSGGKKPSEKTYPEVFAAYLLYEQGCADYDEVVDAARRCLMGARS